MNDWKSTLRRYWVCLALFGGTLLIFSRVVNCQFLDCDDPDYVTGNSHVQQGLTWENVRWALTSGEAANWHPLTWISHMVDWELFGPDPVGPHVENALLHAFNAVLVFLVLRKFTGAGWTAALAAAVFAWHPLRVESVAWVAERKDLLCGSFGLLTLWIYAAYAGQRRLGKPSRGLLGLALLAFMAGLLSKPMLVTLPCLLLVLDWWPLGRLGRESIGHLVYEKVPFLLFSAAVCAATLAVQGQGGAIVETSTLMGRTSNAAVAVAGYLEHFFWPLNLSIGYPQAQDISSARAIGSVVGILGLSALFFQQRQRRPWLLAGWLWFLGMLVPVLGLVQVGVQGMADRYTYLPMLGCSLALLWTLREMKWLHHPRWAASVAAIVLLGFCGWRTWEQQGVWKNSETLYRHSLAVDEKNYSAHCYLGATLFNQNRLAEAETHFRRAVELKPDFVTALYRWGLVLERNGQAQSALSADECALKLRPHGSQILFQTAVALDDLGRKNDALTNYLAAAEAEPGLSTARYNAGVILLDHDQPWQALAQFQRAFRYQPDYAAAYVGAGLAARALGHEAQAAYYLKSACKLDPRFPGLAEMLSQKPDELAGGASRH